MTLPTLLLYELIQLGLRVYTLGEDQSQAQELG